MTAGADIPRFSFGGVHISCLTMPTAVDAFFGLVAERTGGYIACTCTHGIVDGQHDVTLRDILNGSRLTLPDGMPTVWMGRIKGMPIERVTAPDFLETVLRDPRAKTIRHYFYGGTPATLDRIVAKATRMLGSDAVAGAYSPPFRPVGAREEGGTIALVAAARPDVIWVGLGLPKQEYFMANHRALLPSSLMVGVGAAFDWFAGTQKRAPGVLQNVGLEWFHRMLQEPRRLWPRYRTVVPRALNIMMAETFAHLRGSRRSAP